LIDRQDLAVLFEYFMDTSRVQKAIHYQFHNSRSINCHSYLYGWLIGPFMDFTKPGNE